MRGQIETISVNRTSDEYPPPPGFKNAVMGLPRPLPGSFGCYAEFLSHRSGSILAGQAEGRVPQ